MNDRFLAQKPLRVASRLFLVTLITLLVTIEAALAIASFGSQLVGRLNVDRNLTNILSVHKGGAAAAAGIRSGDEFDLERIYENRQKFDPIVWYQPPPKTWINIPLLRDCKSIRRRQTLIVGETTFQRDDVKTVWQPGPRGWRLCERETAQVKLRASTVPANGKKTLLCISIVLVLFSAWMVLARPKPSTWFLFLFLSGFASIFAGLDAVLAASAFGYSATVANALIMSSLQCLPVFTITFGAAVLNKGASTLQRVFWYTVTGIFWTIAFGLNVYPVVHWIRTGSVVVLPHFLPGLLIASIPTMIATLLVAVEYATLPENIHRQRVKWVLVGLIGLLISMQALVVPIYQLSPLLEGLLKGWALLAFQALYVASSAAIAYGVLNHDVVDTSLWISRTFTLGLLAAIISQLFPLSEMTFVQKLETSSAGQWTKIAFILALAYAIEQLRRNLGRFLDLLFFRARYRARVGLKDIVGAIRNADSVTALRELLVDQVANSLVLKSAALFEGDGITWKRTRTKDWNDNALSQLTVRDVIISRLKDNKKAQRLTNSVWSLSGLPAGECAPTMIVPIFARGDLVAILLYGRHANGAEIDWDEAHALEKVAESAPPAFDYVRLRELQRKG